MFRRKLMYEKNTNIKNPVEINLLYSQSRDGILEGVYPCPMEDAAKVVNTFVFSVLVKETLAWTFSTCAVACKCHLSCARTVVHSQVFWSDSR